MPCSSLSSPTPPISGPSQSIARLSSAAPWLLLTALHNATPVLTSIPNYRHSAPDSLYMHRRLPQHAYSPRSHPGSDRRLRACLARNIPSLLRDVRSSLSGVPGRAGGESVGQGDRGVVSLDCENRALVIVCCLLSSENELQD